MCVCSRSAVESGHLVPVCVCAPARQWSQATWSLYVCVLPLGSHLGHQRALECGDGEQRQVLFLLGVAHQVRVDQLLHLDVLRDDVLHHGREQVRGVPALGHHLRQTDSTTYTYIHTHIEAGNRSQASRPLATI